MTRIEAETLVYDACDRFFGQHPRRQIITVGDAADLIDICPGCVSEFITVLGGKCECGQFTCDGAFYDAIAKGMKAKPPLPPKKKRRRR